MVWLLRFLLWTALLALPVAWFAGAYQDALLHAVASTLALPLRDSAAPESLDLSAANSLAVFAALCLASRRTNWRQRLSSLLAGIVAMVAIEWLVGLLSVAAEMRRSTPEAQGAFSMWTWDRITELQHWATAPALWLLLLGRRELPILDVEAVEGKTSPSTLGRRPKPAKSSFRFRTK